MLDWVIFQDILRTIGDEEDHYYFGVVFDWDRKGMGSRMK